MSSSRTLASDLWKLLEAYAAVGFLYTHCLCGFFPLADSHSVNLIVYVSNFQASGLHCGLRKSC